MIYPYKCPDCGLLEEIVAHHTEQPKEVVCPDCNIPMARWFTTPQVIMPKPAYFDHGLGVMVNTPSDVKDALRKINSETGANVEEVGNENNKPALRGDGYSDMIDDLASGGAFDNVDNAPEE